MAATAPSSAPLLQRFLALPLYRELAEQPRWLRWQLKRNAGGRLTKVPDCSTAQPSQWRVLRDVLPAALDGEPPDDQQGIGLVLTGGVDIAAGPLYCVDLDACRHPETGALTAWAEEVLNVFERSYTEVSPSRYGLHVWACEQGRLSLDRTRVKVRALPLGDCEKTPELQVFGTGAPCYVTMTGVHHVTSLRDVRAV
jgi:hypothetical protein